MKFSTLTALAASLFSLASAAPVHHEDEQLGLRLVAPGTIYDGAAVGRRSEFGAEKWYEYAIVFSPPANRTDTYLFHDKEESTLYSIKEVDNPVVLSLEDNVLVYTNNTEDHDITKLDITFIDDVLTVNGESQILSACYNYLDIFEDVDFDTHFLTYQLDPLPENCFPCKLRRGGN